MSADAAQPPGEVLARPRTSAWLTTPGADQVIRNVIALMIRKGGAGKTTLILLLADALSRLGLNVLLIDTDPQGNLSSGAGCKVRMVPAGTDRFGKSIEEPDRLTVIEVLDNGEPGVADQAVTIVPWDEYRDPEAPWTRGGPLEGGQYGTVGIIPCYLAIESMAKSWSPADLRLLRTTLHEPDGTDPAPNARWDVVLIDTPPGSAEIGRQDAIAADYTLMVTNAGKFGMEAIPQTLKFIHDIRDNYSHPDLVELGLVLNEFDPNRASQKQHVAGVQQAQASGVADVAVPIWEPRLPSRTVVAASQDAEAPLSAFLGESKSRAAASVVCPIVERIALRLLEQIGHPKAAELRECWSRAWPPPSNGDDA